MDEQEHRRKVEAVFRKHDADNSGTIDGSELVTALSALNALPDGSPEAQRKFVDDLLARVEPDDDDASSLTLSEFQKLFDLVDEGDDEALAELLKNGVSTNYLDSEGCTVLMKAAEGELGCLEVLLAAGQDVLLDHQDMEGLTALMKVRARAFVGAS